MTKAFNYECNEIFNNKSLQLIICYFLGYLENGLWFHTTHQFRNGLWFPDLAKMWILCTYTTMHKLPIQVDLLSVFPTNHHFQDACIHYFNYSTKAQLLIEVVVQLWCECPFIKPKSITQAAIRSIITQKPLHVSIQPESFELKAHHFKLQKLQYQISYYICTRIRIHVSFPLVTY